MIDLDEESKSSSKNQEDKSSKKKKKDETKSNNPEPLTDKEKNTDSYKDFKKQYENKNITPPDEKSFSDQFKEDNIELSNEQFDNMDNIFDEEDNDEVYETLDDSDDVQNDDNSTDIIKLNEEISNINVFKKHMLEKGYKEVSNRFLAKNFAEASKPDEIYSVNVTINDGIITAITAYNQDNKIVNMPPSVIKVVKSDINESITPFI